MPSTISVIPNSVNPLLQKERDQASFDIEEFAVWWHGGADNLKLKREVEKVLFEGLEIDHGHVPHHVSHEDTHLFTLKHLTIAAKKLIEMQKKYNPEGSEIFPKFLFGVQSHGLFPANNPLAAHLGMFVDAIQNQGTPEQIEKYAKPAVDMKYLGTYAQTELSHGTFVRGIQTTAEFDRKTDEFILNTPCLEAYKFWPAGLGQTVNHAIVVARLIIDNEDHGVQMFIVNVRDVETHLPMPGIDIGEIGPKIGMNGTNQGFLGFSNVRIPRLNMLMKNSKVMRDGTFVKSPASTLSYMTMVNIRCLVVELLGQYLSQASTIATRYAAVRRQSPINPNDPEPQIIDHITQRFKVFPEIVTAISFQLAFLSVSELYHQTIRDIKQGIYEGMADLHVLSCSLKALSTIDGCAGIEKLRMSCGGHGFLSSANIGNIYGNAVAAFTYEGENTVLLLQVGRSLVKNWKKFIGNKKISPGFGYFASHKNLPEWDGSWNCVVKLIQYVAAQRTRLAYENVEECLAQGQTPGEAFNNSGILMVEAAKLHGRQYIAESFIQQITGPSAATRSKSLQQVLENCLELYLVHLTLNNLNDILRFVPLSDSILKSLQRRLEIVMEKIRPDAVAICDGFDYHDNVLNSTLGCYDGNVYERLFDAAKRSPLNQKPVPDSFTKYLKPFMKSNL